MATPRPLANPPIKEALVDIRIASDAGVDADRLASLRGRLTPEYPKAEEKREFSVLSALPAKFPKPEIVVEHDGEIALDWDAGARRLLSVSVGDSAMLGYAALVGPETTHGKVAFAGPFPAALTFLLRRLYPAWAADRR